MRKITKKMKRTAAMIMAGMMCLQITGCGKESAGKTSVDVYEAQPQTVIEHSITISEVIDGKLYAAYSDVDATGNSTQNGILKYDFQTKELKTSDAVKENMSITNISRDAEGNIAVSGEVYHMMTYTYSNIEFKFDSELNLLSENKTGEQKENPFMSSEEGVWMNNWTKLSDGRSIASYMGEDESNYIEIFDAQSNKTGRIDMEDTVGGLYELSDGRIAAVLQNNQKEGLYEINLDEKKLGKELADTSGYIFDTMYKGKDNTMLFISSGYLYSLDYENKKIDTVLRFIDCNINPDNVTKIVWLQDGPLTVLETNADYTETEVISLIKQDNSATEKKKEITLGTFSLSNELQEDIIKFNKTNEKYKIIIREYTGDDEGDYSTAISRFNSDVLSGNCPDIIDFSQTGPLLSEYAKKGILQEISPYIENDSDLREEDFLKSLIDTYRFDGKLYVFPKEFIVDGIVGPARLVGSDINWTLEEFISLAENLPEGAELMEGITRDALLALLCTFNLDQYVDWSKGECRFNDGEFVKLLKFCNQYKSSEELFKDYEYTENENEITKIRDGKILLRGCYLNSFEEYMVSKVIFGEDITFKGYPVSKGNGVSVTAVSPLLAISANSKNKDAAWEYIRQYYLPADTDKESEYFNAFPSRLEDLNRIFNQMTEKHYDENGKETNVMTTYGFDSISLEIPYPDQNDVEAIRKILDSADMISSSNEQIYKIVNDETEAFFQGQKTAEEVAEIIQSRVSIYMKENQ